MPPERKMTNTELAEEMRKNLEREKELLAQLEANATEEEELDPSTFPPNDIDPEDPRPPPPPLRKPAFWKSLVRVGLIFTYPAFAIIAFGALMFMPFAILIEMCEGCVRAVRNFIYLLTCNGCGDMLCHKAKPYNHKHSLIKGTFQQIIYPIWNIPGMVFGCKRQEIDHLARYISFGMCPFHMPHSCFCYTCYICTFPCAVCVCYMCTGDMHPERACGECCCYAKIHAADAVAHGGVGG